jgi:hypothetical protein
MLQLVARQPSGKHSFSKIYQKSRFLCGPCGVYNESVFAAKGLDQTGHWIGELSRRTSEEELVCLEDLSTVKVL